jgi:hypothetical protein
MLVAEAGATRAERYDRWYPLFREELDLVSRSDAGVIAVGRNVAEQLERRRLPRSVTRVMHYSGQAAAARQAAIVGHEAEFDDFASSVTVDDVLQEARLVLEQAALPREYVAETLARLANTSLSVSRRQLMFHYKLRFETLRRDHSRGRTA